MTDGNASPADMSGRGRPRPRFRTTQSPSFRTVPWASLTTRGASGVLKGGSKSKPIRLVEGDHEISCKIDGIAVGLKACFVRKA